MDVDFGELKNDVNFVSKVHATTEAIAKIEKAIKDASEVKTEDLSTEDKIKFDIFLTYAMNSLYWMYLKINGENPATHGIKHELSRIKEAMERQKQIHDYKTIRPVIQKDVAKRFVRGGLYDFKQKNEEFKNRKQQQGGGRKGNQQPIHIHSNPNPQNRKRKFEED